MEIRKFQPEDLEMVMEITKASFTKPWPKSEFKKYLEDSFVAEENGKILGFVVSAASENMGIIKLIATNPNYRDKGIGKSLMKHILKHFAEKGLKETVARCRLDNKTGFAFLKNFGFEVTKTIENYYQDGEAAFLMKKELDG